MSDCAILYVPDVAALLGKTEAQVRKMKSRGQLPPPVKAGGFGLCWLRSDFERWLHSLSSRR